MLRRNRLRWFGHIERQSDEDWVKGCMNWTTSEKRPRGRPKKKWIEVIRDDMKRMGGRKEDAQDRVMWRKMIWGEKRLTRASPAKGR